jgi:F420-non-reducing hydrogenase iron-sulfur subunit
VSDFEPRIVGFLCNWCSYAGADLAGVSRFQYPTNIRSIRVMCSTRLSPHLLLEVFKTGVDGVIVGGCHLGDCHYISGNYYTEKRIMLTRELLRLTGIEPERLRLEWISASEGERCANVMTDFVGKVRDLGPSPVPKDSRLALRLAAATEAAKIFRLKLLSGKEIKLTGEGNVYGEKIDPERFAQMLKYAAQEEFQRNLILELTKNKGLSVKELAKEAGEATDVTLERVVSLRSRNLLSLSSVEGMTPKYKAIIVGGI